MTLRKAMLLAAMAATPTLAGAHQARGQQSADAKPDCANMNAAGMDHATMDHATMDHAAHAAMLRACAGQLPTQPGQAAFGAISEIVGMLDADPTTNWEKVNIEALRQHLIDMDDVMMHAAVSPRNIPGGVELTVTGAGRTVGAIKRIAVNHTRMLDQDSEYQATAVERSDGAIITVTARNAGDARQVARIRGLGFAGLMTEGNHHAAHHLAIARGDADPHGHK